ncbi:uncharacterized protein LOC115404414 [Salarias fasciatus]|uniref:uncharacterized protein LOC115404414 n=1 Tax=Salarias fasciatus TaxID=181472 RepID=UPI001176FA37|nr:uncharacterized protein LOC115404414 [Salarias fasciatus]
MSKMDRGSEYEEYGARPKRTVRLPARYADYEMGPPYRKDAGTAPLQGAARKASFTPPDGSSPTRGWQRRDAVLQEMDMCYGAESQLHSREDELAPMPSLKSSFQERLHEHFTPLPSAWPPRDRLEDCKAELDDIRRERHLLQQTQRRMSTDVAEMRTLRQEMRQLIHSVQNLQSLSPAPTTGPESAAKPQLSPAKIQPDEEDEDEWPAPPPGPGPIDDRLQPAHPQQPESPVVQPLPPPPPEYLLGQTRVRHPSTSYSHVPRPVDDAAHSLRPWFRPIPLQSRSPHGAPRSDAHGHTSPPQLPPDTPWTQQPPPMQPSCSTPITPELSYYGPRPTIPHFSNRDPSEFARLKMSLENLLPRGATELFKYQVLVDHLRLEDAKLIADAYLHSPTPFTDTMTALNEKYGQPHQIALRRIAAVMDSPDIRRGDLIAFERFALHIQSLVGMLSTLGTEGEVELRCGSHVARLLSKLPPEQRAEFRRCMFHRGTRTHTLTDFAEWLKYESWCQDADGQVAARGVKERPVAKTEVRSSRRVTTVLHGANESEKRPETSSPGRSSRANRTKPYCPYCNNEDHYLSQCGAVSRLTTDQLTDWIRRNKRCWRCARSHQAAQCNLRKPCNLCQGKHLRVLHEVNAKSSKEARTLQSVETHGGRPTTEVLYLDRPTEGSRVLLKVVQVRLHHGNRTLNTYAILDDGSERTMLLSGAAEELGVSGTPEDLPLPEDKV